MRRRSLVGPVLASSAQLRRMPRAPSRAGMSGTYAHAGRSCATGPIQKAPKHQLAAFDAGTIQRAKPPGQNAQAAPASRRSPSQVRPQWRRYELRQHACGARPIHNQVCAETGHLTVCGCSSKPAHCRCRPSALRGAIPHRRALASHASCAGSSQTKLGESGSPEAVQALRQRHPLGN